MLVCYCACFMFVSTRYKCITRPWQRYQMSNNIYLVEFFFLSNSKYVNTYVYIYITLGCVFLFFVILSLILASCIYLFLKVFQWYLMNIPFCCSFLYILFIYFVKCLKIKFKSTCFTQLWGILSILFCIFAHLFSLGACHKTEKKKQKYPTVQIVIMPQIEISRCDCLSHGLILKINERKLIFIAI